VGWRGRITLTTPTAIQGANRARLPNRPAAKGIAQARASINSSSWSQRNIPGCAARPPGAAELKVRMRAQSGRAGHAPGRSAQKAWQRCQQGTALLLQLSLRVLSPCRRGPGYRSTQSAAARRPGRARCRLLANRHAGSLHRTRPGEWIWPMAMSAWVVATATGRAVLFQAGGNINRPARLVPRPLEGAEAAFGLTILPQGPRAAICRCGPCGAPAQRSGSGWPLHGLTGPGGGCLWSPPQDPGWLP